MTRSPRPLGRLAAVAACSLALSPAGSLADTIWARSGAGGGSNALPVEGTILKAEAGRLQMQTRTQGNILERPLDQVVKIKADGEPALNEAEEAFEQGKWDAAAAGYDRALTGTRREWVKDRAAGRLLAAAERGGQFPLVASAYAQLAARDPAAAADRRPAVTPALKPQLPAAIAAVERAFAAKPTDAVRSFLGDLYLANGDLEKVNRLVPPGGAKDPAIVAMQAKVALQGRNYAAAAQTVEQNRALFTTPDAQLDALHTLAEARAALAGNDPAKVQDAAIAYMRVVAHFGSRNSPLVADAMYKAAALLERTGQSAEAAALYKQVADDPRAKGTPVGVEAQKKHDQLKGAKPAAR